MEWLKNYPNPHPPGCFWHDVTEKTGAPNIKWCEETLCSVISEPANTWSNLSYILIALWMIYLTRGSSKNLRLYPVMILLMGLGSFFYHASNFYPSQIIDFVGMFLFTGWCLGVNLIRLKKLKATSLLAFVLLYSLALTVIMHVMYVSMIKFQLLVLVAGLLISATEFISKAGSRKWFITSLGLLIIAFSFSISDGSRFWCDPTNHIVMQGHAIWHLIAGLAMGTIYLHYRELFKTDSSLG